MVTLNSIFLLTDFQQVYLLRQHVAVQFHPQAYSMCDPHSSYWVPHPSTLSGRSEGVLSTLDNVRMLMQAKENSQRINNSQTEMSTLRQNSRNRSTDKVTKLLATILVLFLVSECPQVE